MSILNNEITTPRQTKNSTGAFLVNVNMTIKLNNISSMKYIRQAINDGMEFESNEGIVHYDMNIEEDFFVNVNMTIKLNNISSMKYIRQSIEDGMEFESTEGIINYDMNNLSASRDDD
jgi:hypothetical protein